MITKLPNLTMRELATLFSPPETEGNQVVDALYAGYSRFLLRNIFKVLNWPEGSRILVPAYICDVVFLPFAECGIEPVFYGITEDFQVDFSTISVDGTIRGIISVSYFGCSSDYDGISEFAQRHALVWIHDNAHGFASMDGEQSLEKIGDFSITSFRKVILSRNGARLRINADAYANLYGELRRLCDGGTREPVARYAVSSVLSACGIRLRGIPDYDDLTGFRDEKLRCFAVDAGALKLLYGSDVDEIRAKRRLIYCLLEEVIAETGEEIVFPVKGLLKPGNSPLVFPVRIDNPARWTRLLTESRRLGIDLHTWPSLPAAVIPGNIFGCVTMWRNYLYFPIHQRIEADEYRTLLKGLFDAVRAC